MTAISLNLTRSDGELQEFHLDSDDAAVVLEALKTHHDGGKKKKPPFIMEDDEMEDDEEEMMDSEDEEDSDEWTTEDRDDSDDEDDDESESYYEDSEDEPEDDEYDDDRTDADELAELQQRIDYLGSMMGMGEMEEVEDEYDYDEIAEDAVESYKSMMASAYKATMDYLPADMNPFEIGDPIELYVAAIEDMNPDADLEGKSYERIMGMFDALVMGKTDSDDLDSTSPLEALAKASVRSGGDNRLDAAYEEVRNMYENAWKVGGQQ